MIERDRLALINKFAFVLPEFYEPLLQVGAALIEKKHFEYRACIGFHLRRSFCPPLLVGFPEGNQILYTPQPIRDVRGHCRGHAQCTVNLDEVVAEIIESRGNRMILHLP